MKLFLNVLLSLIAISQSFASTNIKSQDIPKTSTVILNESENSRQNKKTSLALRSGSIAGGISGSGVDISFFSDTNTQFGIEYMTGTHDLKPDIASIYSETIDKANLNAQLIGIYGKYFTGNSFAINGGISFRKIEADYIITNKSLSDYYVNSEVSGSATIGNIGIGNYWSWDNGFVLGCEWINYQIPLANKKYSSNTITGPGFDKSKSDELEKISMDLAKLFSSASTLQVLNIYLGYSF